MASTHLSTLAITRLTTSQSPNLSINFHGLRFINLHHQPSFRFRTCASADPFEADPEPMKLSSTDEKFDWFSQWYPIAPVCDLDKRVPHAKRVMGVDLVVWWDRNESAWKAFQDRCPHRLAPLSEGRIDQWGRLQCVYHGWCFSGSGDCKFIPQSPPDAPPFHTFKKARVAAYPCTLQNGIVWLFPNSDPHYTDILTKKAPPRIPELDNPSFTHSMGSRDFPFGYEVLTENLSDPAHVPYAHYQTIGPPKGENRSKADREGGRPMEISVHTLDINGFVAHQNKQEMFMAKFVAPCLIVMPYSEELEVNGSWTFSRPKDKQAVKFSNAESKRRFLMIFLCIPVSPGKSRIIWSFTRNFALWVDKFVPRWIFHLEQNLILDSDLYLLHKQEQKLMEMGPSNWQKAYFVPTKSDAMVVAFRKWLKKYSGGQVDWGNKVDAALPPPPPPREQVMDRYWSHVKSCSSCSAAYKGLSAAQVVLQVVSFGLVVLAAVATRAVPKGAARNWLVALSVVCFLASKWLSRFIYKSFHYHDYNHALV